MTLRTRTIGVASLTVLSVLATGLAAATPRQQPDEHAPEGAQDQRSRFGRLELITGAVSLVRPDEGLLIVTKRGLGQAPSTTITGVTTVTRNADGTTSSTDTGVSAESGPAETDYRFRVTNSTLIRLNGRSATLSDLAGMQDKQATVHFVPQRNGNFAKTIEVGTDSASQGLAPGSEAR
jgi:hypothetical protein